MAVYIASHKAFSPPEEPGYVPLQVGAALHEPLPYARDDEGDSISDKNPTFCELTGLYWIWKNTDDSFKGLVHYRRYFTKGKHLLTLPQIEQMLETADLLVPKAEFLRESAGEEFCLHSGHRQDLDLLRQAVEQVDETYLPDYDRVMAGNRLHLCNMLIARREMFDAYCQWLFAVLFTMEPRVDMTDYTPYERRLFGFLSERLLNVWIAHNHPVIRTVAVTNTERRFRDTLRLFARRQKNRILFALR